MRYIGVHTGKDDILISADKSKLSERFKHYYDSSIKDEEVRKQDPRLMTPANEFKNPSEIREQLLGSYDSSKLVQYLYRPFDLRWLWYETETKLLQRKNTDFMEQVFADNVFIIAAQNVRRGYDGSQFSQTLVDLHPIESGTFSFPLKLRYHSDDNGQRNMFDDNEDWQYLPNVSDFYDELVKNKLLKLPKKKDGCEPLPKPEPVLARYGCVKDAAGKPTEEAFGLSEALFYHTLAVMHAPAYREDHAEYLAEDWPRIPLPEDKTGLETGAELGKKVARLLDPLSDAGAFTCALRNAGAIQREPSRRT